MRLRVRPGKGGFNRSRRMDVREPERKPKFSDSAPFKCLQIAQYLSLTVPRYALFDETEQDGSGAWRMLLTCIGDAAAPTWVPVLLHLRFYRRTKIVGARH